MAPRHKPPISLWIASERKRLGWKVEELSRRLTEAGYEAEVSTVRVWEAGRSPKPETITALETLFDSAAPRDREQGNGDLAEAIRAQTEAIKAQTEYLQRQLELDYGRARAMAEFSAVLQAQQAAMTEIVAELKTGREETQGRVEGLSEALGDLASTLASLRPALAGRSR